MFSVFLFFPFFCISVPSLLCVHFRVTAALMAPSFPFPTWQHCILLSVALSFFAKHSKYWDPGLWGFNKCKIWHENWTFTKWNRSGFRDDLMRKEKRIHQTDVWIKWVFCMKCWNLGKWEFTVTHRIYCDAQGSSVTWERNEDHRWREKTQKTRTCYKKNMFCSHFSRLCNSTIDKSYRERNCSSWILLIASTKS